MTHRNNLVSSLTLLLVALAINLSKTFAGHAFDAYRMAQYDEDGTAKGSRRTRVDYTAAPASTTDTFSRKMIVVRYDELSEGTVEGLSKRENVDGILVLLPKDIDAVLSDSSNSKKLEKWRAVEESLIKSTVLIPVYLAFEDSHLANVYDQTVGGNVKGDGTQFVVNDDEAKVAEVKLENVEAMLAGRTPDNEGETAPTLLVVAHYDSFGLAPGLAFGVDSNGSGMIAILELVRIFARIYTTSINPPNYNLVFLLSAGGSLNFHGSRHWLSQAPNALVESVDFVLCLDSLAGSPDLYLHSTKPPKDESAAKMHELLVSVGLEAGVVVEQQHIKVNGSTNQLRWEHEVYAKRKLPAATLSARPVHAPLLSQRSILDRKNTIQVDVLERNIRIVGEAIARYLFDVPASQALAAEAYAVDSQFVSAWLNTVASFPRAPTSTPTNFTLSLAQAFEDYTGKATIQSFPLEDSVQFYTASRVRMHAYRVKSMFFDLVVAVVIGAFLTSLNRALKQDLDLSMLAKLGAPAKRV
eukprot:c434_g1_i1.p1 GENE.c434_g1_i1~~c434_g1_i1.p1  ORF type:complete len:538 (+),score=170.54 c434_g1_i1:37-1614(+)